MAPGRQRKDVGHGCYFYAKSAEDSFSGHLDPTFEAIYGMNETDITSFIRASRPELVRELSGLPFCSSDVLQPERGLSKQPSESQTSADYIPFMRLQEPQVVNEPALGGTSFQKYTERHSHMYELQYKRVVQSKLVDDCFLKLRKSSDPSRTLDCSAPRCAEQKNPIQAGTFFLTLAKDSPAGSEHSIQAEGLDYHLRCMEDLFNRGLSISTHYEVDGHFDRAPEAPPTFPYHYPSNSPEALHLRRKRHAEIEQILKEVRSQDTGTKIDRSEGSKSPDLKIYRPNNVSPYVRRYKKQGLAYENQGKRRVSDEVESEQSKRQRGSTHDVLICFCREPAGESELIKCTSAACMIGTFHLQCLDLDEPLEQGDQVYCLYCAESLSLEDGGDADAGRGDTLSMAEASEATDQELTPSSALLEATSNRETAAGPDETMDTISSESSEDASFQGEHGFVAVNSPAASPGFRHHAQCDGSRSPIQDRSLPNATPGSPSGLRRRTRKRRYIILPQGPNDPNFEDLAPFISCVDQSQSTF